MKLPPLQRTVRVFGEIRNARTDVDFARQLAAAGPCHELIVQIDSHGGDVSAAVNVIAAARGHEHVTLTTLCTGRAASAALLLFLMGDRRLIAFDAALMAHKATTSGCPDTPRARRITEDTTDILALRTGLDRRLCAAWIDEETWFDSIAARRFKLATTVLICTPTSRVDLSGKNVARQFSESELKAADARDWKAWELRRNSRLAAFQPATRRAASSPAEVYIPPMPRGTYRTLADAPEHIRRQHASPTSVGPGCWRAY